ncbi:MAG: glycosyltransferase [Actinomycetota bacterium]|nr:glycosyltransferase [Actinomycetota bacterium]
MRVLLWHGWLLEGSGSNVYTARVAEVLASAGHDVLLLCQESHPERYGWIEAWGTVGPDGPSALNPNVASSASGRCVLLRPDIGSLLPVFVIDEYEGFEVKRFLDLTTAELDLYLRLNVEALRAAAAWHRSDVVVAGHAIPGAAVAKRALGPGRYVAKIHGSDLEYAVRPQQRYVELAREGLQAARAVIGPSSDVLSRCVELVPGIGHLVSVVPPGVDATRFHPMPRRRALLRAAARLEAEAITDRGRPTALDGEVARALARRDASTLHELARGYDQGAPDPAAAGRLRELAGRSEPLVGYFGKLIPQKGVGLVISAAGLSTHHPAVLIVGFGLYREWLAALAMAVACADTEALEWLREVGGMAAELFETDLEARASAPPVTFTGRLDHRFAPGAVAAMDVLVVPSILWEAFGMVAAEGAAAGALPLVARHSGLAETAAVLEEAVGRPGLLSFQPGAGAARRIAVGIDRLLALPAEEREEIRQELSRFAHHEWSWRRLAGRLLEAALA